MAGLLLGVVLFGVASFVVASAPALAQSAGPQIVVEGNRRVEAETIRSYFKVPPGERLDAARIDSALKALYSSGLFQDIRISQSGGRLIVTVVEAPVIDRIAFEGNSKLKDEQLQQEIQSKPRGTLSKAAVQADVTRIIEVYHRNGRFDVQVVPKIVERPNNRVDLVFEIREGEKTGVRSIIFVGNHAYSDYRLKEVIKTSTSNFLSFLQTTDVYDTDRIEADRDLIRRFYLTHGYADVQVVSATGEYDPAIKGFIITFTIEEGALYHFGNVEVQSNIRAVDPVALQHVLRMHRGDIYNGDSVEKTVEDVTVEITKHGYPFATVRPRGDRDPQNHLINVVFVVDEGVRAYIERINIRGNTRTRDYVIRREFDISEGDPYNRALIDRAERRIKSLNFFKTVKITNEPGSAPDRVVINVDVEEQSTGDFSVMGGYSTADGFMGQVSISERNLMGTGRYGRASGTFGQYIRGIELGFVEPYFLDQRLSAGIDLFARQTLSSPYLSYGSTSYGTNLKTGVPLREDLSFQLRYSIYWSQINLVSSLDNCNNINPNFSTTFPTVNALNAATAAGVVGAAYPGFNPALGLNPNPGPDQLQCPQRRAKQCRIAAGARGAFSRRLSDLARRLRVDLQHPRQQQAPDQRSAAELRPGCRRPWRRRQISAHRGGFPQLLRDRFGSRRPPASARRRHVRSDEGTERQIELRAHARRLQDGSQSGARLSARRSRTARHHASARQGTRSAVRTTGARASKCNIRSTSYPRTQASAAPCSSIPARNGGTRAKPRGRRMAKSTGSSPPAPAPPTSAATAPCNSPILQHRACRSAPA